MIIQTSISVLLSFFIALFLMKPWITHCRQKQIVSEDMHKRGKKVAEWGGVIVLFSFIVGFLVYIAISVFSNNHDGNLVLLFASLLSLLLAAIIGFADDSLGGKIGLRKIHRVPLTLLVALPIMVVNAGESTITLPLIGSTNIGILFPLLLIPIGVLGATNGFNMLAGYNGLEAGMGVILLSTLSYLSWQTGHFAIAVMGLCAVAALLAFLTVNWYPARLFAGNTLTHFVGAMIAIMAILGNIEKFALILFFPYFIEFVLKARGKMRKESFGKVLKDGSLVRPYRKFYGIEHIAISFLRRLSGKAYEWQVTVVILLLEAVFVFLALASYHL